MDRKLSLATVSCCIGMRVAPNDFMRYDVTSLFPEATQTQLYRTLQSIASTNSFYVKLFLAHYIKLLENADEPIVDDIYELYCSPRILSATPLPPTATDTLDYVIDGHGNTVSITETPKIISGSGTTGLRTWEAALFLVAFMNGDPATRPDLTGKTVVELGSGTGLVSLGLLKNHTTHKFEKIVLTDGDSAVVENLAATLGQNHMADPQVVDTQQLWWGTTDPCDEANFVRDPPFGHVVVAADVTYDSRIVALLTTTLGDLFNNGTQVGYVAATVRNTDTIEEWERVLLEGFAWRICSKMDDPHYEAEVGWYRQGTPEIRIYEIRRR